MKKAIVILFLLMATCAGAQVVPVGFIRPRNTFTCGSSITKVHAAGSVAPVSKTVTYGTVTNIPGETTKCWITSNLGASQQATAFDDATETSAGWYWQFNRKQGYKHDGTTRTPNTPWITSISEYSDWVGANDPCTIELGAGWRIPTSTEWTNVGGNLTDMNGPYGSALKLHAAGFLHSDGLWFFYDAGSLASRGSNGYNWSSTLDDATDGWSLDFYNGSCYMSNSGKANGYSIRCVKNLLPTLTTTTVTAITSNTATSGGNVTDDGGNDITVRGVCWGTATGPIASGSHTPETGTTGEFTSNLTGLNASTLYYVRSYATTSAGTSYGDEVSFTTSVFVCGSSTISDIDNNTYNTVLIDTQCWLKENLKVNKNPAGTAIWRRCYNDISSNCDTYGGLYPWSVMMNGEPASSANPSGVQGICPTGWHIPSDAEWTQLTTFLGGSTVAGGKMKETGFTHWNSPNTGATNISGFTGLPGGVYWSDISQYAWLGQQGGFWSTTQEGLSDIWYRSLSDTYAGVTRWYGKQIYSRSVRCVGN